MKKLRWILLSTMTAAFLNPFSGSSINVALPVIGKTFEAPLHLLNWVATSFLLTSAIFLLTASKLANLFGDKRIFITGLILFSIFTLLCGLSQDIMQLIIFRSFQGIGASFLFATSVSILSHASPPEIRGRVLGFNATAIYLGLLLGPTLGGIIIHWIHWRSIFFFPFIISIFSLVLAIKHIPNFSFPTVRQQLNLWENLFYWISLSLLIYSMSIISSTTGLYLLLLALMLLSLFILVEYKQENPLFHVRLFKNNTVFAYSNLSALINYSSTFAISLLLSYYLQKIRHINSEQTGYVLMVQPIMMVIFSPLFGRLSDLFSPGKIASLGMLLITIGLVSLFFIQLETHIAWIIFALFLIGLGFAMFSTPNTNAVMSSVEKNAYSIAAATLSTMRVIGQMLSMGVVMLIFSLQKKVFPGSSDNSNLLHTIKIGFLVFAILSFAGIFFSVKRNTKV